MLRAAALRAVTRCAACHLLHELLGLRVFELQSHHELLQKAEQVYDLELGAWSGLGLGLGVGF